MPCYHPLSAFRSKTVNADTGKRSLVFNPREAESPDVRVEISCGQCIGCRLERSKQWAIRCMHETQMHNENCFLTLTYRPEDIPFDGTLVLKHHQNFMKLLRRLTGRKMRFFHCGEYGEKLARPHYHYLIFGYTFPDKKFWKTVNGYDYYTSKELEKIWGKGFCTLGEANFKTAAYVARYITKKITGDNSLLHYNNIDMLTGEILNEKKPEYIAMSRRPGIGKKWFDKFTGDVFPSDEVIIKTKNGSKKMRVPKYYNLQFEKLHAEEYEQIKFTRQINAEKLKKDNTHERLMVKKEIQLSKFKTLIRKYENDI